MSTYLITRFQDKDQVKALGARWDPARRQWYVPHGHDLGAFAQWLPADYAKDGEWAIAPITHEPSTELALPSKGVPLSQILNGVAMAVSQAFREPVWTTVEVVDTRVRGGHVYLEVSERDPNGVITAKANAVIWAAIAQRVLPEFQQATGAQLGPGIKLLVRVRPVFKAQYGFSLEIDAIDADYTLGDLEAHKREIRERLQREGLFERNKQLPSPWDYHHVLVIAPEGGAGLGDFQAEAERLQTHGVCQFTYAFSRFQGDGAAAEIRVQLLSALEQIRVNHPWVPDAVVIIRGGGAVNDMAWLNDYALVRSVCELDIPVLTGIGHERDNTVLDEVAHLRFDTPSKVIAGIERTIVQRVQEAKASFEQVSRLTARQVEAVRRVVQHTFTTVEGCARQNIATARQRSAEWDAQVKLEASYGLRSAAENAQRQITEVRHLAHQQLQQAKREVPIMMADIRAQARQSVQAARHQTQAGLSFIIQGAASETRHARDKLGYTFSETVAAVKQSLQDARKGTQALMREITGQGPDKTLQRGFALVRDRQGQSVTSARTLSTQVTIEFRDGTRQAVLEEETPP